VVVNFEIIKQTKYMAESEAGFKPQRLIAAKPL